MNLPTLIKQLYGTFVFTGLYSFEFVDKNRNTITEIFFMIPPKGKSVMEATRSSTVATLGNNYVNDAGNATKTISLSGELYFPYIGSPNNPVAVNNTDLENTIDGLNEFFKLRWMLIRYRDYTLSRKAKMTIPTSVMAFSGETTALYNTVSDKLNKKVGALYDEVQLIFHDYDMDDHWYCRVANFSSQQSSDKYLATNYSIEIEGLEPDTGRKGMEVKQVKPSVNDSINAVVNQLDNLNLSDDFDAIQDAIGYDTAIVNSSTALIDAVSNISDENESIQSGTTTAFQTMPALIDSLLSLTEETQDLIISTFLTQDQQTDYENGDITIDDIMDFDLVIFYNTLQKIKISCTNIKGVFNSIPKPDEIRFYSNNDNYTLSEEQFSGDENIIDNTTEFYYYTVLDGDTARIIALRELKDIEKYINILQINNIAENDFIDGSLVGTKIKIPTSVGVIARGDDNLVYESQTSDIDKYIYGADIITGLENKLKTSSKGDLLTISGSENVVSNVIRRISNTKGSLNVFNPNWGVIAIDDSNAPLYVKIDRYLTDMIDQVQSDPRIKSVKLNLDKLKWNGETITSHFMVFLTNSDSPREVTI